MHRNGFSHDLLLRGNSVYESSQSESSIMNIRKITNIRISVKYVSYEAYKVQMIYKKINKFSYIQKHIYVQFPSVFSANSFCNSSSISSRKVSCLSPLYVYV